MKEQGGAAEPSPMEQARQRASALRESVAGARQVSAAALGVRSKAPYKLLVVRESLLWRTEELARNGCIALEAHDLVVASIMARAILENGAVLWKVRKILEERHNKDAADLDSDLMRLLLGTRHKDDVELGAPFAFKIQHCLESVEQDIPGVKGMYSRLSEIAHPNYPGAAGMFSLQRSEQLTTYFGRGISTMHKRDKVAEGLAMYSEFFITAYNMLGQDIPKFVSELERLWPDDLEDDPLNAPPPQ